MAPPLGSQKHSCASEYFERWDSQTLKKNNHYLLHFQNHVCHG